jgi:signal transduction histidine kinase
MKQYLGTVLKDIKILQNIDEILKKGKEILDSSFEFLICSRFGGLRLVYHNYFDLCAKVMEKFRDDKHKGIRMVTSITDKESADLTRKFLKIGVNIKHAKNMPPIDFSVSDKEMIATIEKSEAGEGRIKSLLVSNERPYISHFVSIFEELWKEGTDALDRIRAIEEGIEPEIFEVITDPLKATRIISELAKSIKKEAIFLLPGDKSMRRVDRLGIIDYLINASLNGATVKIICPLSHENDYIVKKIYTKAPNIRILNSHESAAGFLIVDREKLFRAELREQSAEEFSDAIGFTLYSNSKRSVESFRSVFDLLWNERMINEQLQKTDELQKEFIHIAAHELRNPIQPILGLSEVMRSKITDPEHIRMLDVTIRNAKRLRRLTEDILDVSKIESQMPLQLNKEKFDLNEFILNTISEFKDEISKDTRYNIKDISSNILVEFVSPENQAINVNADRSRINQVLVNLLSNAVKFTDQGKIVIRTKTTKEGVVVITVEDEGTGIAPEIMPRLFTKFATRSDSGTGLGLFISKAIIEAHGGSIWAQNHPNGKGASFSFCLPLTA